MSKILALFRMTLGLAVLADLARWLPDFAFFFTSRGPLPLSAMVVDTAGGRVAFSLYNSCTYAILPYLLFLATALAAVAMTAGYRCQHSVPALWLLVLSLQNRVAVALDRGDLLLFLGLTLGLVLPWDRAWSYRPSPLKGLARWGVCGLVLLVSLASNAPSFGQAAEFFALGPRAHPSSYWYVVVGVDEAGKRWDLDRPQGEPDFTRAVYPQSYRKRLYLGSLHGNSNWGLRYWLAFRNFLDQGDKVREIEVYECDATGHHLFARWPMEILPQGSATSPRNGG